MKINKDWRIKVSNKYDGHDKAILMACEKFEEIYPNEDQPSWLKYCMSLNVVKNKNKNWVVKFLISPKAVLEANQYWEWKDDGIPLLVQIDPKTNKKSIIICGGAPVAPEVFFEVEIDLNQNLAIVLKDTQLNKLDGSKYEINTRLSIEY